MRHQHSAALYTMCFVLFGFYRYRSIWEMKPVSFVLSKMHNEIYIYIFRAKTACKGRVQAKVCMLYNAVDIYMQLTLSVHGIRLIFEIQPKTTNNNATQMHRYNYFFFRWVAVCFFCVFSLPLSLFTLSRWKSIATICSAHELQQLCFGILCAKKEFIRGMYMRMCVCVCIFHSEL